MSGLELLGFIATVWAVGYGFDLLIRWLDSFPSGPGK